MKTALMILAVCAIAIIAGGGLSFVGYQASSSTITVTSTQTFPTTTTMTSGTITTTTATTQVTNQNDILDHTYSIKSPGNTYCGQYDEAHTTIDPGTVSISFSVVTNDPVDFWMLNSQQWTAWQAVTSCTGAEAYKGMASRIGVSHWDTTVTVPSTDVYYFVFMNENSRSVSISLSVTQSLAALATEQLFLTSYTTQSSSWQTSALAVNQQQAGLGPVFFLGVALLVIGAIAFGFTYMRSGGKPLGGETRTFGSESGEQVTIEVPPPEPKPVDVVGAATQVKSRGRRRTKKAPNIFCPQCGTELPADSTFCKSCGTKIEKAE